MGRDPVKNRANVARHRQHKKERMEVIVRELFQYVKKTRLTDSSGRMMGYKMEFKLPEESYERLEQLAIDCGQTIQEWMDVLMEDYNLEVRRLEREIANAPLN